jgi:hypothetical protein
MIPNNVSIPQLIMCNILEHILDTKCSYNNRSVIKPFEIDCYFNNFKIGWEYDGKYYHETNDGEYKDIICRDNGITLFHINEESSVFRNYALNIKSQIIEQIPIIEHLTNIKIDVGDLIKYEPVINFPNKLTLTEKKIVSCKKLSEIKKIDLDLYNRVKNINYMMRMN